MSGYRVQVQAKGGRWMDMPAGSVVLSPADVEKMRELGRALRDVTLVMEDYSDGRMDSLVALGKVGVRLLNVDTDLLALLTGAE